MSAISVDELIATLKRTSIPTILVEGRDDMTAYRWLEDRLGIQQANVLPCGGRNELLAIYDRRNEFSQLSAAFLADRDMWLFATIPNGYDQVVFTRGYSIENDILDSSPVHKLLSPRERCSFGALADVLATWFAFEVEQFRAGLPWSLDIHPNRLVPPNTTSLNPEALKPRIFAEPKPRLRNSIRANFGLRFRGKSLLQVYVRFLSARRRPSKFSKQNLLEIGTLLDDSRHLTRLVNALRRGLQRAKLTNAPGKKNA